MAVGMSQNPESAVYGSRRAVVIVNPTAHNAPRPRRLQEASAWLSEHGWATEWLQTAGPGDATTMAARAAEQHVPLLFVCGGDGTLSEAANGLAGSETVLAVIPAGTINLWAREVGLRRRPVEAVRLCAEGERRRIDLGRVGKRYFLLMAGYGMDAAVAHRASMGVKRRLGAAAYAIAALVEALRYRGVRTRLRLDGETAEADVLMVVAGNTRSYAGLTEITPDAVADDGLLDVCIYKGRGRLSIVGHALRTLVRRHHRSRTVIYRRVQRLEMDWEQPLPLQLDGDPCPDSPAEVRVAPGALWVAVPAGLKSPLFSAPPGPG